MIPRLRALRTIMLAATLVAVGACPLPTDAARLGVTLVVNHTETTAGAPTDITITVVNRSSASVQADNPYSYGCDRPFVVRNVIGTRLTLPPRFCFAVAWVRVTLAPGDSIVINDRWSADEAGRDGGSVPVVPGRYSLVARVVGDGRELSSEPVWLTVLPAATK